MYDTLYQLDCFLTDGEELVRQLFGNAGDAIVAEELAKRSGEYDIVRCTTITVAQARDNGWGQDDDGTWLYPIAMNADLPY